MTLHLPAQSFAPDRSQPVRRRWLIVAPARLRTLRPVPGDPGRDHSGPDALGQNDLCVHVRWPRIDAGLLAALAPDAVVAPLMTPHWDVLDLAAQLGALGYAGRVLIDAPDLPRPRMVLAELCAQCPGLNLGFLAA